MKREAELLNLESPGKLLKTMTNKHASADRLSQFISPNSDRPDQEAQRYDRQLRLWQNLGQKRIENASILISDCGATSCQIAKNLTLAGIGRLNLYDQAQVRPSDIGNNFFLDQSSLGKPRVEVCRKLLAELNRSTFVDGDNSILVGEYGFDFDFCDAMQCHELDTLIGVRLTNKEENEIRHICWCNNVPCIFVQTCGLVASISVEIRELGVIETHPESLVDLRLDCPFPEMSEFVNSFEMDKMDNLEHAHIPAVVILIHFLERFKSEHNGKLPQDPIQRLELKNMILAEKRSIDEDNFDEAIGMIWKACQETRVPIHIEKLFHDRHCQKIPKIATQFWFLVKCLREFVRQDPMHQLPLSGVLPDMKSDTKNYIKLQSIYRQKAQEDLQAFRIITTKMKESFDAQNKENNQGQNESTREDMKPNADEKSEDYVKIEEDVKPEEDEKSEQDENSEEGEHDDDERSYVIDQIPDEVVDIFVKNCAHLRLIRREEHPKDELISKFSIECEADNEEFTTTWFIAFDAMRVYRSRHQGHHPGTEKGKEVHDLEELTEISLNCLVDYGWDQARKFPPKLTKALQEIVRSGGSELPHISSLVGGIVSQEVIKLVTQQYIPLNATCIFDGYKSTTGIIYD